MSDDDELRTATSRGERRILWQVLLLNIGLAAALAATGIFAESSGLLANALDNASDAGVYCLSLLAIGRSPRWKALAARASGVLLFLFGVAVLGDAVRRVILGSEPVGGMMMGMSLLAAAVNLLCLWLLRPLRRVDVNMRAAQTFSVNDFVSNLGILVAGGLVLATGQLWPDIVVGVAVAGIAIKGSVDILRDARETEQQSPDDCR